MQDPKNLSLFEPTCHAFFDDLVTMLMSLSSYMLTVQCAVLSNNPKELNERSLEEWVSYIRPVMDPNHFLTLEARSLNQVLIFYPFWMITPISLNGWPQQIVYQYMPSTPGKSHFIIDSDKNTRIISRIIGSSFISYYESQIDSIKAKHGDGCQTWPDALNFARHVRNGFAHGGAFYIPNPHSPTVNWRIWQLDPTWNGRRVLFEPGPLGPGDVICLMEEINRLLKE